MYGELCRLVEALAPPQARAQLKVRAFGLLLDLDEREQVRGNASRGEAAPLPGCGAATAPPRRAGACAPGALLFESVVRATPASPPLLQTHTLAQVPDRPSDRARANTLAAGEVSGRCHGDAEVNIEMAVALPLLTCKCGSVVQPGPSHTGDPAPRPT